VVTQEQADAELDTSIDDVITIGCSALCPGEQLATS
jgi:hypothetical protein